MNSITEFIQSLIDYLNFLLAALLEAFAALGL